MYTLSCNEHERLRFRNFWGPMRVLSLPEHVLSDSSWSKDSIEWWNISVGQIKPILWPFLEEKVTHKKSGKSWNIFDLAEWKYKEYAFSDITRYQQWNFYQITNYSCCSSHIITWEILTSSKNAKNILPKHFFLLLL